MRRFALALVVSVTLAVVASVATMARQGARNTTSASGGAWPSTLMGTIRDADGKPLNGVPVSARASDETFTTSVYTDDKGEYVFPTLPRGDYSVWAQAVGFATARVDLMLDGAKPAVQAFVLKPLANFEPQLTGVEWYDALPDDTADHRRLKQITYVSCADCHTLAVVSRKITEIETLVIRNQNAAENLDKIGAPRAALLQAVPERERMSRDELVRTANMYFSGLELNDGKGEYPFLDSCARLENGSVTAGDPAAVPGAPVPGAGSSPGEPPRSRMSCRQQFESGMFHYVTRIRDRRFVVVDRERGIAFAFVFFDNAAGEARNVTLSDGRKVVSGSSVPWTWQIAELFKIEKGRIGPVESVLHPVPYGMGSGWSTWEDQMSSRPRW